MNEDHFDELLTKVAQAYEIEPGVLLQNLEDTLSAMDPNDHSACSSSSHIIPHAGGKPTLEDYINYLARTLPHPYDPDQLG